MTTVLEDFWSDVGRGATAVTSVSHRNDDFLSIVKTYRVVVKDSSPMILARPKSASFTERFLSARRIFSGLMSRWTMLRSCYARQRS